MRILSLTRLAPYGIAVLSVGLAAAVRQELDPVLGESAPLLIFLFAVILSSWFGGFRPGLLATALSFVVGDYLFLAPRYSIFRYDNKYTLIHAILFVIFGMLLSLVKTMTRKGIRSERGSREAFRLLVEGVMNYAIYMLDRRGRLGSWNSGAERITGIRRTRSSDAKIQSYTRLRRLKA